MKCSSHIFFVEITLWAIKEKSKNKKSKVIRNVSDCFCFLLIETNIFIQPLIGFSVNHFFKRVLQNKSKLVEVISVTIFLEKTKLQGKIVDKINEWFIVKNSNLNHVSLTFDWRSLGGCVFSEPNTQRNYSYCAFHCLCFLNLAGGNESKFHICCAFFIIH